jgi:signal peptidase II
MYLAARMKTSRLIRNILILTLLVTNIGCDQVAKYIVRHSISYNDRITVIDNFVTITRVENTGAFLSMGNNLPRAYYYVIMVLLPLAVIGYATWHLLKNRDLSKLMTAGMTLFIGGGLGNIWDRIIYGSVTDFLYFDFHIFHTGIVNIADISLTAGCFIILIEMVLTQRKMKIQGTGL